VFRTRRFIFRKKAVRTVWYNLFQYQRYTFRVHKLCHTCRYSLLTEDEPSSSQHVEDMILIYLLTAIGLTPGASSTVQYTFTQKQYIEQHNQYKQYIEQHNSLIRKGSGPGPVFARYTLAFWYFVAVMLATKLLLRVTTDILLQLCWQQNYL
jgi:hypothetical protein